MLEKQRRSVCIAVFGVTAISTASLARAAVTTFVDPTVGLANQVAQETAFQNASGPLTLIDFEDQTNGAAIVGNEYVGLGITFSQPGTSGLEMLATNPNFVPRSGVNALWSDANQTDGTFNVLGEEDLQMDLTTPQKAVGFWLIDSEADSDPPLPESIDFFAADLSLIVSIPTPITGVKNTDENGNFFIGVISSTPIARVIMFDAAFDVPDESSALGETVGWDDVQFGVPEPATMALLTLASVSLWPRRPRRGMPTST